MDASTRPDPRVAVFDPSPVLTITLENLDGRPDLHVHAGGQGVWVARLLVELGVHATLCAVIGGETGDVLDALARDEGIELRATPSPGSCGAYISDRRSGERRELVTVPPAPLGRHVLDELYGGFLAEATGADVCVLAGPRVSHMLPDDTYRRLAADGAALGVPVIADLSGNVLHAAVDGGLWMLKVSEDELRQMGWLSTESSAAEVLEAATRLHSAGAHHVVVSRGPRPALALIDGVARWAHGPVLSQADHRGAGDSLTGGIAAGLARGLHPEDAVRLGIAAGAIAVSRHGLATADRRAIDLFESTVELRADPEERVARRSETTRDRSPT